VGNFVRVDVVHMNNDGTFLRYEESCDKQPSSRFLLLVGVRENFCTCGSKLKSFHDVNEGMIDCNYILEDCKTPTMLTCMAKDLVYLSSLGVCSLLHN